MAPPPAGLDIPIPVAWALVEQLKQDNPEVFSQLIPLQRGVSYRVSLYPLNNGRWLKIKGAIHLPDSILTLNLISGDPDFALSRAGL